MQTVLVSMLLSVIIPIYNVAAYLAACLRSVETAVAELVKVRSEVWVEVICVNDGSTDESGQILSKYMWHGPVICKNIRQDNMGVSAARNAGLAVATGEWVAFLDGDDTWAEDVLVQVFDRIHQTPLLDAVGIRMTKVDVHGRPLEDIGLDAPDWVVSGDAALRQAGGAYGSFLWLALDKFYRRDTIEKLALRFPLNMPVGEDVLFNQCFLAQCGQVILCPSIVGYQYFIRQLSASTKQYEELVHQPFRRFFALEEIWRRTGGTGVFRRLQKDAAEIVMAGKEHIYAPTVRSKVIEQWLASSEFLRVVRFMLIHGTAKSRCFSVAYLSGPRRMRRKLLAML